MSVIDISLKRPLNARIYRCDIEILNLLAQYKPISYRQLARLKGIGYHLRVLVLKETPAN